MKQKDPEHPQIEIYKNEPLTIPAEQQHDIHSSPDNDNF